MALFNPSASPAVVVREVDLTGGVPNVQSSTGVFVGNFNWGPVLQRTLIGSESGLAETFTTPNKTNARDFISAAKFLTYSQALYVTRIIDENASNAYTDINELIDSDNISSAFDSADYKKITIRNEEEFEILKMSLDVISANWIARFPGALGNSLKVSYHSGGTGFENWEYSDFFDAAPNNDEVHVVVVDENGLFTGSENTVLETYQFVSKDPIAKNPNGTTNYINDVINNKSQYVYFTGSADSFSGSESKSFDMGNDSSSIGVDEYQIGFDLYNDIETVTIDFLISPSMVNRTDHVTMVNYLVSIAEGERKDCVVITSPAVSDMDEFNPDNINTNIIETSKGYTRSSYLVAENNFLKVYDKYNDQYIDIPAASSTAGIMAATDLNAAPWFSPAGTRRGNYLGVTTLKYNPTKKHRDELYKVGVNPIANIPGQGILLYGDKTFLARPSAFDRINVRRLFLVLERAISRAAKNVIFELNDEFTRAEFVNIVEPVLREVQGRRGLTDYKVVCDETNNTPAVVDRNEFVANIFIKPTRSINFVTLNFVAVRSGVSFEEVVGTV
jgi:uncharacterized protein YajQ (UPF0234 family)